MRWAVVALLVGGFGCASVSGAADEAGQAPEGSGDAKRNVILFVGDGMGVSTVTAARILEGQQRGEQGEENYLSFERFDNVALIKTYNTDSQISDSAGTMSAIVTGAKTRAGVISVGPELVRGDCVGTEAASLPTLLEDAEDAGMLTGVISTARITHATPAAAYAHAADRNWEADAMVPEEHRLVCRDIAAQLVEFDHGDGIDVILGGGRAVFLPSTQPDPEDAARSGARADGRHLIDEWLAAADGRQFVWNTKQLRGANRDGQLLGLFELSHMQFEADREADAGGEPSLAEMTEVAIERLSRGQHGFFLIVEAGRIDHGHHAGNAYRALLDTIAYADAVQAAVDATDARETMILVTADHSHTLTISGYAARGNPILGFAAGGDGTSMTDSTGRPYTTLSYANGPGHRAQADIEANPLSPDYRQVATWPMIAETHAGEDVPAYATGPGAAQLRGVMDQDEIYWVLRDAMPRLAGRVKNADGVEDAGLRVKSPDGVEDAGRRVESADGVEDAGRRVESAR